MHHKTLFKHSSTGQVWEWHLESSGDKFRTHSGLLDGEIVISAWTVCLGKNQGKANETSPREQCLKEVEACYTLKMKKGYQESLAELDSKPKKFSPMLAKEFSKYEKAVFNGANKVFVNPKLDGIRLIAKKDGLWSRAGNRVFALRHIEEALAPFFKENPKAILDGEAYSHELKHDFNKIVSLVKQVKPKQEDFDAAKEQIKFYVYDLVSDDKFSKRFNRLAEVVDEVGDPLVLVPAIPCKSRTALDEAHELFLADGYEGTIVRVDSDAGYEQKRTKNLLKHKNFQDKEFPILAIEEGTGNRSGMAGYAVLKLNKKGKTFRANIMGNRDFLRTLLARRDEVIDKDATVTFFNLTPDGVPRFPRIKVIHVTKRW